MKIDAFVVASKNKKINENLYEKFNTYKNIIQFISSRPKAFGSLDIICCSMRHKLAKKFFFIYYFFCNFIMTKKIAI